MCVWLRKYHFTNIHFVIIIIQISTRCAVQKNLRLRLLVQYRILELQAKCNNIIEEKSNIVCAVQHFSLDKCVGMAVLSAPHIVGHTILVDTHTQYYNVFSSSVTFFPAYCIVLNFICLSLFKQPEVMQKNISDSAVSSL